MKTLAERVSDALEAKGCSITELAIASGVKPPSVSDWLNGKTKTLKSATAIRAARFLGVRMLWLTEGTGPMKEEADHQASGDAIQRRYGTADEIDPAESGFAFISRVRFRLSAGVSGFTVDVEDGESAPIFFRKDWFVRNGYRPDALFAVRVTGDSMVPSLYDGDLVVVNTADNTPRDGEVFAVNYEGELVIKRIRLDSGACWLDSDAADQIRFRPRQCGEGCFVLGRVVYKQSERI